MPIAKLKDFWRMFRHLTFRKAVNAFRVYLSFYLSRWSGSPIHWGMPVSFSFEPTTACNLRCPECPSGLRSFTRPTGNLKMDFFRTTLDELSAYACNLMFYFQGEPYIHPEFLDMVAYAESRGIYTVTSTNGHFLNEENVMRTLDSGLSRIILSIDGTTQEAYAQYRKEGKLETVLQGAERLVKARREAGLSHPYILFQFLVTAANEDQVTEIHRLAKTIGVDEVKLKTAQFYDFERGNPLMPRDEQYSRYVRKADGRYGLKNQLLNHCWRMWHACVLTWDGKVVPCCFDKDASIRLGDLRKQNFHEIWKGEAYQAFRQKLLLGRKGIEICKNCTEGSRVWA